MNADVLLEHFHRLGDAPDAVPRLRRFVLELATEGRLTEAKRDSLLCKPLGKLAEFVMGQAPPGVDCNEQGEGTLFVKVGEFGARYPEERAWTTQPLKFAQEGDVLICVVGATIGKLNLGVSCAIGRSVAAIRPARELDQLYLYYSLMPFTLRLREDARGTAQGVISRTELNAIEIWCPPLPEQHRIVAKVDELMALCDRLEAAQQEREQRRTRLTAASWQALTTESDPNAARFALEQLPALTTRPQQIAALRQTILDLAVRGRLVKQDATDEPAEVLLKRIAKEKERLVKEGKVKKEKAREDSDDEDPTVLPKGWVMTRMEELTELITKGSSPKWQGVAYVTKEDGVLFITSENVGNYRLRKLDDLKYVERKFNEIEPRSILRHGDILVNLVGASIGRAAVYDLHDKANINQAVALIRFIRCEQQISTDFLLHYLNSTIAIDHMLASRVVTAQPNMSLTDVRDFPIPLPPLAEQRRIVAKVDELMRLCDGLEAALVRGEAVKGRLLEAVLAGGAEVKKYAEPKDEVRMAAEP